MPLSLAEMVWSREGLDGPVLVDWGRVTGRRPDLAAAAGGKYFLFTPSDTDYFLSATVEVGAGVLSLAAGMPVFNLDNVVLGLEDRLAVYGSRQGTVVRLGETEPEPGARFVDLALADIDGDGREEVIAAAEGKEALYFYRQVGEAAELQLELLAIRILPGPAQKVSVLGREGERIPLIAAAYRNDGSSGLLTLIFTEMGFQEGPALGDLPVRVTSLAGGDLRQKPGEELAWGGADGAVRVMEAGQELVTAVTSDNLGSFIPALAAGRLVGESTGTLIAGTPEGFLFGFKAPVEKSAPDWAVSSGRPVNDLAVSDEGLLGLGTADGGVQVWLLSSGGNAIHTVRPGETLALIAGLYKTTVEAIAELNRIDDTSLIFPGQKMLIP